ncbi:outer membrane protein (porin) [Caballeronia udeis]|uniref:Outer membrane protein (Porin) n=1 Tax=Caballeronia udeis TaxID=1232866 RepID=A0A158JWA1_9BURK|nr:porin [Caballeronia udeis]SAL73087.1 outer membrane protein (porin) [Caballeronia udeis]
MRLSALLIGAAYTHTHGEKVDGQDGAHYQQINFGADYLLSKRTDLYLVTVLQKAGGVNSTEHAAVAAINGATPSSTDKQIVAALGIRQRF